MTNRLLLLIVFLFGLVATAMDQPGPAAGADGLPSQAAAPVAMKTAGKAAMKTGSMKTAMKGMKRKGSEILDALNADYSSESLKAKAKAKAATTGKAQAKATSKSTSKARAKAKSKSTSKSKAKAKSKGPR